MTAEQQRIAIAEACGWEQHRNGHWYLRPGPYDTPDDWCASLDCKKDPPDYLNDLNAMHEAEKVLTDEQSWEQIKFIVSFKPSPSGFPLLSRSESIRLRRSTAAQRAEAFLRTIGKWTPSSP
jgi:hypothetical protein